MNPNTLIDNQMKEFADNLQKIQKDYFSFLERMVYKSMVIDDNGFIVSSSADEVLRQAETLLEGLYETGYSDLVSDELFEKVTDILDNRLSNKIIQKLDVEIDPKTFNSLLKINFEELDGIGETIAKKVKSQLMESVLAGSTQEQAIENIQKILTTNFHYAETYMRTAKQILVQDIENKIADELNYDGIYEYVGAPLQENSHKECIYAVPKRYFTEKEKAKFEAGTLPAKLMGRSAIRWNCQHAFFITDKALTKELDKK